MSKVSVIIPTYNCAKYIGEAIDSVLTQSYKDFELIIVDDGSTDDTGKMIKEYINKYPHKLRYFYQENKGPGAARNKGILESKGNYVAFLDADDIWLPKKLEKQIMILENNLHIGFVYCDNYFVDNKRRIIPDYIRKVKILKGDISLELFCEFFIITSSVILRMRYLDKIGLFNETLLVGEDYDFFLRLVYSFKAEVVEEKLLERRVIRESLSRKDFILDAKNDLNILRCFLEKHADFYKKYKKIILLRLSEYHFSFAYRCLEKGKNAMAFSQLIRSFWCKPSIKSVKNIIVCLLPYSLRKLLKERLCPRSA